MTFQSTGFYLTTNYEETTARKHSACEKLTDITDEAFELYEMLEQRTRYTMNKEPLDQEKKYMYKYILNKILPEGTTIETFMLKCF